MQVFPQFIFLSNPHSEYEAAVQKFMNQKRYQIHAKQHHRKQLLSFAMDPKYIDSVLTQKAYERISEIKKSKLDLSKIDTIVVAPLKKSLQTCYQLLRDHLQQDGRHPRIKVYIDPFISDRLNSSHAIGDISMNEKKLLQKYYKLIINSEAYLKDNEWIYDILPQRIKAQLLSTQKDAFPTSKQYFELMKGGQFKSGQLNRFKSADYHQLESKEEFMYRLQASKDKLIQYSKMSGSNRKLLVIGSSQTLSIIGATGFHQNGDPVNSLRMNCGEVQWVSIVKYGDKSYTMLDNETSFAFCGM